MKLSRVSFIGVLSLSLMSLMGCGPVAKITVLSPAEIDTKGIRNVAVGKFEIGGVQERMVSERGGVWESHLVTLSAEQKESISRAVRSRVVNLLTTTPFFKVIYTDEFAALENDAALQQLVSTQGYQTQNVDAVLNGKLWIEIDRTDGAEIAKVDLNYIAPSQYREGQLDVTVGQLVWWPYKSTRGTLALEMKMTRVNPTQVVAVTFDTRTYSHKIGGPPAGAVGQLKEGLATIGNLTSQSSQEKKEKEIESSDLVLPSYDQLVADLALSIAANFVKRVAVTEQVVSYPVASGDPSAKILIEAGAYGVAIERLQKITGGAEKKAEDLYNLGLCFEAVGDYDLALNLYRDAFKQDSGSVTYAAGIGRIERILRERPALKRQLTQKQS